MVNDVAYQWKSARRFLKKSCAQVEGLVVHALPNPRGLKPDRRISSISVRLTQAEKDMVKSRAGKASLSVNAYLKAVALGPEYTPPRNPELVQALLSLNRELTAQGRNLNQIARRLNANLATTTETEEALEALRRPLIDVLGRLKTALAGAKPYLQ